MGWSEVKKGKESLSIGDDALDFCNTFLENFGKIYTDSDLARLPTEKELLYSIQLVLHNNASSFLSDVEGLELTEITAKFSKKKANKKAGKGDVIAVPIGLRGFAFLHVLEVRPRESGIVGILPYLADFSFQTIGLKNQKYLAHPDWGKHLSFELTGVSWGFWKVVGHLAIENGFE